MALRVVGCDEHRILYRGYEETAPNLKAAGDVLFLGNSHILFGLQQDQTRPFLERHGLLYYSLGFSNTEPYLFPELLIRQYDLHPKLVMINATLFFKEGPSAKAKQLLLESDFDSKKQWFESTTGEMIRGRLYRQLSYFPAPLYKYNYICYRSRLDGTWYVPRAFDKDGLIPLPEVPYDEELTAAKMEHARAFTEELQRRGARVIFISVPNPYSSRLALTLAQTLDTSAIVPSLQSLVTVDGAHLDRPSATRYTTALLQGIEQELTQNPLTPR